LAAGRAHWACPPQQQHAFPAAAGGQAAESAGGANKERKGKAWRSHAVERVEAGQPAGWPFRTPADLARVRARHARWPRCGVAALQQLATFWSGHEQAMKL
jgi:hypothetical protein